MTKPPPPHWRLVCAVLLAGAPLHAEDYQASIGESPGAPVDYAVTSSEFAINARAENDYEPPHNTRIDDPYHALVPALSPETPLHVRPHSRDVLDDIEDRPFFDYNGWQTFVALIWPAAQDGDGFRRGVPDRSVTPEAFLAMNTGPKDARVPVFETLLTSDDLFIPAPEGSRGVMPQDWFATTYKGPFALDALQKGDSLDEAFSTSLIDQNRQYVRYQVQVNRVFYDFIRENAYYWKGNLPKAPSAVGIPPLPVPSSVTVTDKEAGQGYLDDPGPLVLTLQPMTNTTVRQRVHGDSITIKTAWRIMIETADPAKPWQQADDLSRYYTTMAEVENAVTGAKEMKRVGLVGMHAVVRTTQFPQGLWSTFGHVDNLPPEGSALLPDGRRASFNGNGARFFPSGYSYAPEEGVFVAEEDRQPVEVSRVWKIPDTPVATPASLPYGASTLGMNQSFQELFGDTVWRFYQLEVTNWPTDPGSFYAKPFLQMRGLDGTPDASQPLAVQQIYQRNQAAAANAFPRWSGLPIPQVGALNPVLETYFQNPPGGQALENTSCMGCHYGASDLGYVWVFKLGTQPSPYSQGRVNPQDSLLASTPGVTPESYGTRAAE